MVSGSLVAVIMGSQSDGGLMQECLDSALSLAYNGAGVLC